MPIFNILILVGLVAILLLLVLIVILLNRGTSVRVSIELDDQLDKIRQATAHYADVVAIVTMMRQLEDLDEDAEQLLLSYPKSMRAAVWLHYMNVLASDAKSAQAALSRAHTEMDDPYRYGANSQDDLVQQRQQKVDDLHVKLDAAIAASVKLGLREE